MMNYSPMGVGFGGNSSSSSSNLSALAPPFTVDRLNPNFNSNPLMQYPDSTYPVEPFKHLWQYACPSAPGPELAIDSTGNTGVHLSDTYGFSACPSVNPSTAQWTAPSPVTKDPGAFGYGGEIKPYYSSHVPPLVGDDKPLVPNQSSHYNVVSTSGMSRTPQLDYAQSSFDLEYGTQGIDSLGFDDGKRTKKVELNGIFSSDKANVAGSCFHNQLNQGGFNTGTRNKFKEDSDFSYQRFNQLYDTEFHTGALNVGHVEDKDLGLNFGFFTNDSKKPNILGSSSIYQNSHSLMLSSEMHSIFPSYQSSYASYDKCVGPDDALFTAPPSVMRSSPTVVIRPPPATNVDLRQSTLSHKLAHVNNGEGVRILDFGCSNPSKQKEIGVEASFSINEDNSETNLINLSKLGDGLVPSTSVKEMSSALHPAGTFDHKINAQFVPQLPDLIVSSGSAIASDNFQLINPDGVTSDFADSHNLGVDSPCWKGAPYSKLSQFDVEVDNTGKIEKSFGEYHEFHQEEDQYLHPLVGSDGDSSGKIGHDSKSNENEYARTDGVLKLGRTLDSLCSSNEQSLLDAAKCSVPISTTTSGKDASTSADANIMRKEFASLSGFKVKDCNTEHLVDGKVVGITQIYASEGGDVAVHAAEKVLDSPTSHDDSPEHPKLPVPKLDVPTIINAMYSLSEVLLCSNHADSLDGDNIEILKHTIRNIDSCLSKKVIKESDKPELSQPIQDTFEKLGKSCDVGTNSENHLINEAVNSDIHLEHRSMHEELGIYSSSGKSGKKDKKLPKFSPFMDDIDPTRDDNMAKAIKKILEENFDFDEEMHSQALCFRNLWLEAEAKLCSISYKARFDRMKIQLEEAKFKASQAAAAAVPLKADECTFPKSTVHDFSISCTSGPADGVEGEASVMERYNILKSREENPKPMILEEAHEPKMVDGEHAPSVMVRLNILKSREGNSKLMSMEQEHDMIGGEHTSSVMARFNILKSREDNSKTVNMGKEQLEAIDGDSADWKYVMQCSKSVSENEGFKTAQIPHFRNHINSPSLDEGRFYLPVKNGPVTSQDNSGSNDSSLDWEHVLKDDVSSKNS